MQVAGSPDAPQTSRPLARRIAVGLGMAVAIAAAFSIGRATAPEVGTGPAIDVARRIGVAMPVAQQPAFADGEITIEEVKAAHQRFVDCVERTGPVAAFESSIDDQAMTDISYEPSGTPNGEELVRNCRIEHLHATQYTFLASPSPGG